MLDENSSLIVEIIGLNNNIKHGKGTSQLSEFTDKLDKKRKKLNKNLMTLAKWADESSEGVPRPIPVQQVNPNIYAQQAAIQAQQMQMNPQMQMNSAQAQAYMQAQAAQAQAIAQAQYQARLQLQQQQQQQAMMVGNPMAFPNAAQTQAGMPMNPAMQQGFPNIARQAFPVAGAPQRFPMQQGQQVNAAVAAAPTTNVQAPNLAAP
jgi:hypothetical protein